MKYVNNLPYLSTLLCSFSLMLLTSACSNNVSSAVSTQQDSLLIPGDIKGVVYIESPKIGTLLQLRGIAGKGVFITREANSKPQDKASCVSSPIRLAAGDFGGSTIGVLSTDAIWLLIYSDKVAKKLTAGDEVVSENYAVTDQNDVTLGDIKIESGLTLSYGFVLNPGEWSWSSLFGIDKEEVDCEWLNASFMASRLPDRTDAAR